MADQNPTLFGIAYASRLFREVERGDSLRAFREKTPPVPDLRIQGHALALLEWLNHWGCRITKGSFPKIIDQLGEWFQAWGEKLPRSQLQDLAVDDELNTLADAYNGLLKVHDFGPTSAAKTLFALCPHTAIPWDARIQEVFGLPGREKGQYREMLVRSGAEADALITDAARCGVVDLLPFLKSLLDMPDGCTLALPKFLDEYHWVTITRGHKIPACGELKQWIEWTSREATP